MRIGRLRPVEDWRRRIIGYWLRRGPNAPNGLETIGPSATFGAFLQHIDRENGQPPTAGGKDVAFVAVVIVTSDVQSGMFPLNLYKRILIKALRRRSSCRNGNR